MPTELTCSLLQTPSFLQDTIVYLAPFSDEYVYIVHHVGTALFLLASLHSQVGGSACLFGLLIGEVTNPFFHVYNCLDGLREWHPSADSLFRYWAPVFTAFFLIVRTVLAPPTSFWWCSKVAAMDAPLLHRSIWIFASVGIMSVSQLFSYSFAKDTYKLLSSPSTANLAKKTA